VHSLKAFFLQMVLWGIIARALDVFVGGVAFACMLNSELSWRGKLGAGFGILVAYLVLASGLELAKPYARKRLTSPQDPTPEPGPNLLGDH
jgi:ABC-type sugar transport system permease subunit